MTTKYDQIAGSYDFLKGGDTRRWREAQLEFFKGLKDKTLYVGMGTGQEILHFPPGLDITAIDLSWNMMAKARNRAANYPGTMRLAQMNVETLAFPDETFDSILTVCVFCTVEHPVEGFKELKRVLKPDGRIFSFEHVLSRNPVYGTILQFMSLLTTRTSGTHLDRDTVGNLRAAGFSIESERNLYLDIVKAIVGNKK